MGLLVPTTNTEQKTLHSPIHSFWMGGFECSDKINCFGERVDLLTETNHIRQLGQDYELLKEIDITTVREGIRWSKVEPSHSTYDFKTVKHMMEVGSELGVQQIWDLCHFGFPDDLSPLHPQFISRFVALCRAFGSFYVDHFGREELIITPINEISFLSWLAGEAAGTVPFCKNEGWNIKYKLMQAFIQGVKCLKDINPSFRILTTEPLVNIVPDLNLISKEHLEAVSKKNELQFQVLDMAIGKMCPELGGHPELIDIIGLNYYYNNQWIYNQPEFLPWANENNDFRWKPLHSLIEDVYKRYPYPIILAETSHAGEHRPQWIDFISRECKLVLEKKIPFWGICIYPIIDRPDWDHITAWHHSGLWDFFSEAPHKGNRVLNEAYALSIRKNQHLIHPFLSPCRNKTRGYRTGSAS